MAATAAVVVHMQGRAPMKRWQQLPVRCGIVGGVHHWLFNVSIKDKLTLFISNQDGLTFSLAQITAVTDVDTFELSPNG